MRFARRCAWVALAAACVATSGAFMACSTPPIPAKEPDACKLQLVNMTVMASTLINPSELGQARPVQLRLYQLASDVRLQNADFEDIWKRDKETLKEDLVSVTEMSVYPNSRTEIQFQRDEKAMVIAAVALFRNPTGRTWMTTFDLPPPPGKGNCAALLACPDGNCPPATDAGPLLMPRYAIWIDGSKVDEGEDHLEDEIPPARARRIRLPFAAPAAPVAPPTPTLPEISSEQAPPGPQTPQAPKAPTPSAPQVPSPSMPSIPTPKVGP